MLLQTLLLQAPEAGASLMPLLMALIVMVFFIVPSWMQRRKHAKFLSELSNGSTVYTHSGIIGTISKIEGNEVTLLIDEKTKMRVLKSAIGGTYSKKAD